jgi:outer membrane protein assembly factor BamD (BamD/ComL family)
MIIETNTEACGAEIDDVLHFLAINETPAQTLLNRGKCALSKQDYGNARRYFQRVLVTYPIDNSSSEALFYFAESDLRLDLIEDACSMYISFVNQYPGQIHVGEARRRILTCCRTRAGDIIRQKAP